MQKELVSLFTAKLPVTLRVCVGMLTAACLCSMGGMASAEIPAGWVYETWQANGLVHALAQDAAGFIWVATPLGLRRFDGIRFTDVPLPQHQVPRVLASSRDNGLWVATGDGMPNIAEGGALTLGRKVGPAELLHMSAEGTRRVTSSDGLPSSWILSLATDANGGVWVGTESGLANVSREGHVRTLSNHADVSALAFAGGSRLYAGCADGLWSVDDVGQFKAVAGSSAPVYSLLADPEGGIWAATRVGLQHFDSNNNLVMERAWEWGTPPSLAIAADGALWVGHHTGLFSFTPGQKHELFRSQAGPAASVTALLFDREGTLWVGHRTAGLVQLRPELVHNYGAHDGLNANVAFSVMAARDGSLWATTERGVSKKTPQGKWSLYAYGNEVPSWALRGIAEAPNGDLWFTDGKRGLVRHRKSIFENFGRKQGLNADEVRSVGVDAQGGLWVGTALQGLMHFAEGTPAAGRGETITSQDGLCAGPISGLFVGKSDVYTWGPNGVSSVAKSADGSSTQSCLNRGSGLPGDVVTSLHVDASRSVWMGFNDGSLARLINQKFVTISPTAVGLPGGVFALATDAFGGLWATGQRGVRYFPEKQLTRAFAGQGMDLSPAIFDAKLGMRSEECIADFQPGIAIDGNGLAWVPTTAGLSSLFPLQHEPKVYADTFIDSVRVAGRAVSFGTAVAVPSDAAVEISYTAPTPLGAHSLQFETQVSGEDRTWVAMGARRDVLYARLTAGRRVFVVRALDAYARPTGREARVEFDVVPVWWRRTSTRTALGVFVLVAAFALYQLRVARMQLRHETANAERGRIARELHDGLAQVFASLGLQLDALKMVGETRADLSSRVDEARYTLEQGMAKTRQAIWELRTNLPVGATIKDVIKRALSSVKLGPQLRLIRSLENVDIPVSPVVAHELERIIVESLVNVVKHANAQVITVEALCDEEGFHLAISDDGQRLSKTHSSSAGAGLIGMAERASRIGADLVAAPRATGTGFEVRLFLPTKDGVLAKGRS